MGNVPAYPSIRLLSKKFGPRGYELKISPRYTDEDYMEVRSSSDRIGKLKKKMTDVWMANGVRLAWLIDPKTKKAFIYRPGRPVEELEGFERLLWGEDVCPGFELDLRKLL